MGRQAASCKEAPPLSSFERVGFVIELARRLLAFTVCILAFGI